MSLSFGNPILGLISAGPLLARGHQAVGCNASPQVLASLHCSPPPSPPPPTKGGKIIHRLEDYDKEHFGSQNRQVQLRSLEIVTPLGSNCKRRYSALGRKSSTHPICSLVPSFFPGRERYNMFLPKGMSFSFFFSCSFYIFPSTWIV